jgi:glutaminyl-peptide cyclotransferase
VAPRNFRIIPDILLLAAFLFACNAGQERVSAESATKPKKAFALQSPALDFISNISDSIYFEISGSLPEINVDSTIVFVSGRKASVEKFSPLSFSRKNLFTRVGRQNIRLIIYFNDSLSQTLTTRITVLSDIEPEILRYTVIRELPHSTDAYTQGLFYHEGFLFEGTGQRGRSKLMKIDPADGTILMERKLGNEFFGEGIARWKDKIYQLTYQQKVGFVYQLETFEQIREFDLQTMEGWGLTTNENDLIVSDGSSVLYFYEPEYFSQVDQLDICNKKGLVTQLNELEYAENSLWANVYGQPFIIKIEPATGKVLGRLNLEALFPKTIPRDIDHVLNGIAYNPLSRTYYITGKFWPVLYEIRIHE